MNSSRFARDPAAPVVVVGGGQSGLAAARALLDADVPVLILEAGDRRGGAWPHYYDSLRAFSPTEYNAMPGLPFPGPAGHYPTRDEVLDYLERYADSLDVEVRLKTRVTTIREANGGFAVLTDSGEALSASGVVAASGSFGNPFRPTLTGEQGFTRELVHVAEYRSPQPYAGRRVIVVGAGDSAAQVAQDLARVAKVTVATRHPVRFIPQHIGEADIHYWLRETGFDALPAEWLVKITGGSVVTDSVGFEQTLADGGVDQRPMFAALDRDQVIWSDGARESVDAVILATGYRPDLDYLHELGALDAERLPLHSGGISVTHVGLVYVGLEFQRSYASNTLRGVGDDARAAVGPLVAWVRGAHITVGLGAEHELNPIEV